MGISQLVLNCIGYKPNTEVDNLYPKQRPAGKSLGIQDFNKFTYFLAVCGDPLTAAYDSGNPNLAEKLDKLKKELYQ